MLDYKTMGGMLGSESLWLDRPTRTQFLKKYGV